MAIPRKNVVSLTDTPYYHCVSRCVRRAYLCGTDQYTGRSYEHRRGWVEKRMLLLSQVYAMDICAYAVMSNHVHIVLRVDDEKVKNWTSIEVVEQWHKLFKGTLLTQRYVQGGVVEPYELAALNECIEVYRQRLSDISWFMRSLNEPIARQANKEDGCSGRFWEGRFKSQALLDEAAIIACMVYVDLNPIRAKMVQTPENSKHTSIHRRIKAARNKTQPRDLLPFIGNEHIAALKGLAFHLKDYVELVDQTGRCLRNDKRGFISDQAANILTRLNIAGDDWLSITNEFGRLFTGPVGSVQQLSTYSEHLSRRRRPCVRACQQWFG